MLNARFSNSLEELFTKPTVIQLRRLGNDDEKCFLIALLLVWLYEHCETRKPSSGLQHLTLIEEAHRILQNVPPSSSEAIGARNQAVNTFSNMLAEIRAYGEGMIIVDQIPAKLTPDVVKNTDLKILHRLVAADDRKFVGDSMTLTDEQNEYVAKLRTGEAVVYYEAARSPLLLKFDRTTWDEGAASHQDKLINKPISSVKRRATCTFCQAPCNYGDDVQISAALLHEATRTISGMLVDSQEIMFKHWQHLLRSAYQNISSHKDSEPKEQLEYTYCLLANTVGQVVDVIMSFQLEKPSAVPDQLLIEIDAMRIVVELLENSNSDLVNAAVAKLAKDIQALSNHSPKNELPGCSLCRQRCTYGFLVSVFTKDRISQVQRFPKNYNSPNQQTRHS